MEEFHLFLSVSQFFSNQKDHIARQLEDSLKGRCSSLLTLVAYERVAFVFIQPTCVNHAGQCPVAPKTSRIQTEEFLCL